LLKLLLDAHMPFALEAAVRAARPTCEVVSLVKWEGGELRTAKDEIVLQRAAHEGLTLVTYDVKSIPRLLQALALAGGHHGGVILVHRKTIAPQNVSGLARALIALWDDTGDEEWANRVEFLRSV
jgi:predicted nuclease of predicted toxin-antitoxin system